MGWRETLELAAVSLEQAAEILETEVGKNLASDEVFEIYNELFPEDRGAEDEAYKNDGPLIKRICDRIRGNGDAEDLVYLWELILTKHRNVWFNEEDNLIYYDEEHESLAAG